MASVKEIVARNLAHNADVRHTNMLIVMAALFIMFERNVNACYISLRFLKAKCVVFS